MLVVNLDNIKRDDLYFCYSPNLYKFLKFIKFINPISSGIHRKKGTKFSVFIKTNELQDCLNEWKENKLSGVLAIPRIEGDVIDN